MEIHKASKKDLQQREVLKISNDMHISDIKTSNMQLNSSMNKRSDVINAIINHIFQNSMNDVQTRKKRKTKFTRRYKGHQHEQEPAHLSSLFSFPIDWIKLEA